jgi:hypothetical protein
MNINPVSMLFPSILQPNNNTASSNLTASPSSVSAQPDASDVSVTGRFLSKLQQLQQQNPNQFNQVISQITSQLQQAAQDATNSGNTTKANQLNTLANQFQSAANGGQLPAMQQLQQAAVGGHHHGGHHHGGGHRADPLSAFLTPSTSQDSQNLVTSLLGATSQA